MGKPRSIIVGLNLFLKPVSYAGVSVHVFLPLLREVLLQITGSLNYFINIPLRDICNSQSFLYLCLRIGGLLVYASQALKGNQVQYLSCSRNCNLLITGRLTLLPLFCPQNGKAKRPEESQETCQPHYCLMLSGKKLKAMHMIYSCILFALLATPTALLLTGKR
jgi:hypothetical protein